MMKNWQKRWCSIKDGKFFISSSKVIFYFIFFLSFFFLNIKYQDVPPNHVMDLQEFTGKKADESTTDKKFTFLLIPRVFSQRFEFLKWKKKKKKNNDEYFSLGHIFCRQGVKKKCKNG